MVEIKPFRGWFFDETKITDMNKVVAPPHDVISEIEQEGLYQKSPYNVVRLILPKGDNYSEAAKALETMLSEKIIIQDEKPAYYIYEQDFYHRGQMLRRFGFLALVRAEPLGKNVLPHEMVFSDRIEDRLNLLHALRADLSPVFGLYKDLNSEVREALWCGRSPVPLFEFTDTGEVTHRIWPVYDHGSVAAMFQNRKIIIADGHHRYTAAANFAESAKNEEEKYVLMYLVGQDDPALIILPTHRLLSIPEFNLDDFLKKASNYFNIEEVKDVYELESVLLEADRHTFGMHTKDKSYVMELKDKGIVEKLEGTGHKKHLEVSVLHEFVIGRILGVDVHKLEYAKKPDDVHRLIEEETHDVAFLLRQPEIDDVVKVVEDGDVMPHKSTYFYPKPLAGMIIRMMDSPKTETEKKE